MKTNNSNGQLTYQLEIDKQQKNGFPIPCDFYSTGKLGVLYPTQALEVSYGDSIKNISSAALQFNPLAVPIMANMFVKQEHYYTPYNCVWYNWDNFISGGEDGTFTTPPPTISMQGIMNILLEKMRIYMLNYKFFHVNDAPYERMTPGDYLYLEIPDVSPMDFLCSQMLAFMTTYGMVDIYKHMVEPRIKALDKWFDEQRNAIIKQSQSAVKTLEYRTFDNKNYVLIACSKNGRMSTTNSVGTYEQLFDIDYVDPLFEEVKISLRAYANSVSSTLDLSDENPFLFNDYGNTFIRKVFSLFKPFVGVGSYLDCLNINRMTETDFYYSFYASILSSNITNQITFALNSISNVRYNILALRVQYLIWYNNYRDQLLETKAFTPDKGDTVSDVEILCLITPRVRCWEKDSYTTALDNPATANAVVPILNQRTVDVAYQTIKGMGEKEVDRNNLDIYKVQFADGTSFDIPTGFITGINPKVSTNIDTANNFFSLHMLDAVKRAQKFMRKALFYGNRIQDFIYTNFGVQYLDARLRLPEILSASSDMVELSTLVNNTTTDVSVAGDRAGFAKAYDKGNYFDRYCEEEGLIMSFLTVMPDPTYAYGSDRMYAKHDRFDYPFPDFATLGMDAVYDSELVSLPTQVVLDNKLTAYPLVFGYQGRYYDKKFRQSTEHGELLTTQDMYTFGRRWNMYDPDQRPKLNYEFVHCFPPLDMFVMEDETEDYFKFNVHHDTTAELILPYHSIYL